ncbi:MAG: Maf family protein, partial [Gammaproteobacteria bacterium]|nr:Maf family protein [Gammaproteobacteria bacterium]
MSESVTNKPAQIILASASPRRRELLQQIGLAVKAQSVDIDESQADGEPVIVFVERLAMEKAQRGFNTISNEGNLPVLGSDTIVEIAGQVLGKPEDRQHAKRMLQKL